MCQQLLQLPLTAGLQSDRQFQKPLVKWAGPVCKQQLRAAQASLPKCCDMYSASIMAAAPTSATLAVRPSADSSTLLALRSLQMYRQVVSQPVSIWN